MEAKTYFASSVPAAMDAARRELGPDAMLVHSRPAPEAARPFGRWEVTFAWEADTAGAAKDAGSSGSPGSRPAQARLRPVEVMHVEAAAPRGESGLEDIRLEISALRSAFGRHTGVASAGGGAVAEVDADAVESLRATGIEKDTACRIASAAADGSGHAGSAGLLREIVARIPAAGFTPPGAGESRTLAFVGPPGRGKTASLIKIAFRYGLAHRIPVQIFSAGAHGVGAAEQMARYAAILGVPFQAMESFESLNLALRGDRW